MKGSVMIRLLAPRSLARNAAFARVRSASVAPGVRSRAVATSLTGKAIEVAKGEDGSMLRSESSKNIVCELLIQHDVPVVVRLNQLAGNGSKPTLFAFCSAPVVDQFVAGYPDEPGDRHGGDLPSLDRRHGGEKRFGGQVFGNQSAATAPMEVAVHLG